MLSASRRLWQASPLTYVGLVLAVLLSIYPFYYLVVIATRSLDAVNQVLNSAITFATFSGFSTAIEI